MAESAYELSISPDTIFPMAAVSVIMKRVVLLNAVLPAEYPAVQP
jgi:hypothetical protein